MAVLQKSLNMMNRRERRSGILLLGLTILKGIFDTVGVASILPFLSILGQPELIETNRYASRVYQTLGFTSVDNFLFALGLLVIFTLVVSAALRMTTTYATNRWIEMRTFGLSRKLLQTYLRHPYAYFLTRNSSRMATLILQEVRTVTAGVFRPAINFFSAAVTFVLISSLLLWANPLITITSVLIIGTSYIAVYFSLRGYIKHKGQIIIAANEARFKRINETFSGIKQVKLSSLENFALDLFSNSSKSLAKAMSISATLSQIPRYALEVLAFGGIIILTLILFEESSGAIEKSLPLLGLYALAGYRLLPVLQQMYNTLVTLRLSIPAIDKIYEDLMDDSNLANLPRSVIKPMPLKNLITFDSVYYTYPGTTETGLQKIDLEIHKGESLGVVGTTGAGKTTLVDVLLGLLENSKGSIFVDDIRLDAGNVRNWQANIGYVPQEIFLSDASVAENIAIGVQKSEISVEKLERAAKTAKLYDLIVNDLPSGFETLVGERGVRLSGGQRQRLGIARALYHEPEIIVFDEATSALDTVTERELIAEISQMSGERTVIMIAHRLSTIRYCDRIVVLDKGRIVGIGPYEDLMASNSKFKKLASH